MSDKQLGGYQAIVGRDRSVAKGPGKLYLYNDGDLVGSWEVITGGDELDPSQYGGCAPPITWRMIEPISRQTHPSSGSTYEFSRIYPAYEEEMSKYCPPRTVDLLDYPFMIHSMGRSTGCIGPYSKDWDSFKTAINNAFFENGGWLEVEVKDI